MITRPLFGRKGLLPLAPRPLPAGPGGSHLRQGAAGMFRPPPPHVPLDPTLPAQAKRR